jgi:hypothetical protein
MQIADRFHTHVTAPNVATQPAPPQSVTPRHIDSSGSTDDGTSATFAGTGSTSPYQINVIA